MKPKGLMPGTNTADWLNTIVPASDGLAGIASAVLPVPSNGTNRRGGAGAWRVRVVDPSATPVTGTRVDAEPPVPYRQGPLRVTLTNVVPSKRNRPPEKPNQSVPSLSSRMLCTWFRVRPPFSRKTVNDVPS
jgi:hypothetical protein